jgi:hypothetical protein
MVENYQLLNYYYYYQSVMVGNLVLERERATRAKALKPKASCLVVFQVKQRCVCVLDRQHHICVCVCVCGSSYQ